ncbi:MAG: hypothetical protein A2V77_08700 [Anaeromyxobacter sp. RBG_16_69_14]|nr:MAG: hypothetical protein A2V77_08700 [Anaeromyxobacter sp. RBG_16_69_14]
MRYPLHMNTELQQETPHEIEVELPDACVACGGSIAARFMTGSARGVCLRCHLITALRVARTDEGMQVGHAPVALA